MEDPKELLQILSKIQSGIAFFKANFEYKKSDVYLRRFDTLKQKALEKINVKVLKVLREVNSDINLRIVMSDIFEKALSIDDLDVA